MFQASGASVRACRKSLSYLHEATLNSPTQRARICAHPDADDSLHEMLIVLSCGGYVRPHRHRNKSESIHIVTGKLDLVLFDSDSGISEVIRMGDYNSGLVFYHRLNAAIFHSVIVKTDFALVHETTNGPFRAEDTEFAAWSPDPGDSEAVSMYLDSLGRLTSLPL